MKFIHKHYLTIIIVLMIFIVMQSINGCNKHNKTLFFMSEEVKENRERLEASFDSILRKTNLELLILEKKYDSPQYGEQDIIDHYEQ
jgi:hypothetical protein